jgi:hypothetical protein
MPQTVEELRGESIFDDIGATNALLGAITFLDRMTPRSVNTVAGLWP